MRRARRHDAGERRQVVDRAGVGLPGGGDDAPRHEPGVASAAIAWARASGRMRNRSSTPPRGLARSRAAAALGRSTSGPRSSCRRPGPSRLGRRSRATASPTRFAVDPPLAITPSAAGVEAEELAEPAEHLELDDRGARPALVAAGEDVDARREHVRDRRPGRLAPPGCRRTSPGGGFARRARAPRVGASRGARPGRRRPPARSTIRSARSGGGGVNVGPDRRFAR